MRALVTVVAIISLVLISGVPAFSGTPGSFRGKVVDLGADTDRNWIYVQGRNGTLRRVEISHAQVEYDEDVPAAARTRKPQQALVTGAEVRVTAEQGNDGEWRASRIEILQPSTASTQHAGEGTNKL